METSRVHSKYYFYALLIIAVGIFLRFFMLANQSLWLDEGYSVYESGGLTLQENISRILSPRAGGDRFQPLYFLILFYWRQAFGSTEFAIRSLSALLGVGTVITLFFTALKIYGKEHAIWSLLLVSVGSFGVYYSQEARPYALLLLLASTQLYFFSNILSEGGIKNEAVSQRFFWVFTAISLVSSIFFTGIFSVALFLSHILFYRDQRRWYQWWIPVGFLFLLVFLFYLASPITTDIITARVVKPSQPIVQNISSQPLAQNILFVLYGILVGTTYGPPIENLRSVDKIQVITSYWPQILVLLFVGFSVCLSFIVVLSKRVINSKYQRADYFLASVFIISFTFALLFAIVAKFNWVPRHSFFLYIPLILLLPSILRTRNISRHRANFRGVIPRLARFTIILLLILNVYSLHNYYFNKNYWRDDYRSAARYLIASQDSSVRSVLLFGMPILLSYYGDTSTLDGRELKKDNFAENIRSLTSNSDTVLIAVNRELYWQRRRNTSVQKAMSNLYTMHSKASFQDFNIYRFVRR